MVICLERGADLHTAQLMPLPLAVSCFSKIQIGFTFLVPAHPGKRAVKRVCVCVCVTLLHHVGVRCGRRSRCSEGAVDQFVDVGRGTVPVSEEQRLQHAAVDAEERVQGEEESGVAQLLGRVRPLNHVLQTLTRLRVHRVRHVATLQRRRTCMSTQVRTGKHRHTQAAAVGTARGRIAAATYHQVTALQRRRTCMRAHRYAQVSTGTHKLPQYGQQEAASLPPPTTRSPRSSVAAPV